MKTRTKTILLAASCTALIIFAGFHPTAHPSNNNRPIPSPSFAQEVYQQITQSGIQLSEELFKLALMGFEKLNAQGRLSRDSILTMIDFTKSSKEKRMFVVDLKSRELLYQTVVAHGRNTGEEYARRFSNTASSHQSSLGFYITGDPYNGSNGYSLTLEGVEKGFNDKARERAIVVHGAPYASESMILRKGYLGRSFGCPSLPPDINDQVINRIKKGNCLFIYYPDQNYLRHSGLLNG